MFTVIFAIPRTLGLDVAVDGADRGLRSRRSRARARSTPAAATSTTPIEKREGPEKITGPPARRPKLTRRGAQPREIPDPCASVTERHGSEVTKGKFDTLDEALEHARARVDAVLREGRLGTVSMLREFTPTSGSSRGSRSRQAASSPAPRRGWT